MFSSDNVREINRQIDRELREVRMSDDHNEKLAAIDRIAKLKALLSPQPSREEILAEVADALAHHVPATPAPTQPSPILELIRRFIAS